MTALPSQDISITKITNIEGDVSVNQRKGRVKQLFDLEISFEYKKTTDGSTGTGFISEFTADYEDVSDLNLKLTPKIDEIGNVLKAIGGVVKAFKAELHEVHGKPLLLEANASNPENCSSDSSDKPDNIGTKIKGNNTQAVNSSTAVQSPAATTTILDEVTFPCPPEQLYLMLTDPSRLRSWTRSPAAIPQLLLPGAPFTLFDGNISCKFIALKSNERIEMEWKLRGWSQASNVVIDIGRDQQQQGTVLKIKQSGVPSGEADVTKNNWHNYYWNPIKRAFGVLL